MDIQSFARASAVLTSRLAAELERCFHDALRRALIDGLGASVATSNQRNAIQRDAIQRETGSRPPPTRAAAPAARRAAAPARAAMTDNRADARPTGAAVSKPVDAKPVDAKPAESKPAEPVASPPSAGAFARAPLVIPVRVRTRRRAPKRSADEIALVESRIVAHVEKAPGAAAAAIAAAIGVPKGTVSWPLTKLVDGGKLVASTDAAGQKTYAPAPPPEPAKTRIIRRRAADAPRIATLPTPD